MKKVIKWLMLAIIFIAAVLLIYFALTQDGMKLESRDVFIKELEARGYKIKKVEEIQESSSYFGVPRLDIVTDKATYNVYEFTTKEEASKAAASISLSGSSIKTAKMKYYISWATHPHFYCSDKLIVFYGGRDPKVLIDMRRIMGKQSAGAKWYELFFARGGK